MKTVILAGNWRERSSNGPAYINRLHKGVLELEKSGKAISLVADVPNELHSVPDLLAKHILFGAPLDHLLSRQEFDQQQRFVLEDARRWSGSRFRIISEAAILCAGPTCPIEKDGKPLYRDSAHLSKFGATLLAPVFYAAF